MKAKERFEDWIEKIRKEIQDCVGDGDLPWITDKLKTLSLVSQRMDNGK